MADLSTEYWVRDTFADGGLELLLERFDDRLEFESEFSLGSAAASWDDGRSWAVEYLRELVAEMTLTGKQRATLETHFESTLGVQ